ncbi:MAG: asparagine synthase (glutamine-hydrolyzing) [Bryobacteraceae bacterium]|nr:asparagine synthase (glutamine-hydrolyzing) [Bryobacteraceae bacterium]
MCGIAGIVSTCGGADPVLVGRMIDVIRHRGPDDSGVIESGMAALGHRRLSIVDLSSAGHQPMTNEDGSLWITYNGEIFNHAELRPELERAGHRYRSRTDTETILHAYEQYGADCLSHFRGMFAFAIWDASAGRLFCARDRLGIKPFYWWSDGRTFAFASEIKALLEHPAVTPTPDETGLAEYLAFGYRLGEETMFRGIRRLMPGHWLSVSAGQRLLGIETQPYWKVPLEEEESERRSETEWVLECRRRLEETVRMRLMSDVPLGVFLSGGVDSGAIAALAKRMVPGRIKSFSVGYEEAPFSELDKARMTARALETDHREVRLGVHEFFELLPRLIWHEDEPICWPSSVSLYAVSRLAAEDVKVVLTGEGSDEIFAGYSRYELLLSNMKAMRYWSHAPAPLRRMVRNFIESSSLLSANFRRKLGHTFLGRGGTIESLYLENSLCAFDEGGRERIGVKGDAYGVFRRYWDEALGANPLRQLLRADQQTYLTELLMKQDQMSMACSIESRVPLLDHRLVEFSARVPNALKLRRSSGKYIFKRAVEDLLPREIVWGPKKGFPTPLTVWLRDASRLQSLSRILTQQDGLLSSVTFLPAVRDLLERQASGKEDATDRIWRLLNLQLWGSVFITGTHVATGALSGHCTR